MKKLVLAVLLGLAALATWFFVFRYNRDLAFYQQIPQIRLPRILSTPTPSPGEIPTEKTLFSDYHVFQTFNNCGPASLSMTLFYYGINKNQAELGEDLRPWQVTSGDNDDKSVTLEEIAEKAKEFDLIPFHRPNGNVEILKQFIANDIPVITRTWTKPDEDIGHYRVVKGYDSTRGFLIQDDSLQGKNIRFTYSDFNAVWKKFNYEYLVLVPKDKKRLAEGILGKEANAKVAWKNAADNARDELAQNPNDIYARFNLAVALYNIGDYRGTVTEFEKIESELPFRTLWYQIEPILAYQKTGQYDKVFEITDRLISNGNRAFSEIYQIRGEVYQTQGKITEAEREFEKVLTYNRNFYKYWN